MRHDPASGAIVVMLRSLKMHGMAQAGVSAFPQAVTRQMVMNFLTEGAAANVFARSVGADVQVVDAGVSGEPIDDARLIQKRIGNGTANAI